jgi:hypothetical protein
MQEQIDMLSAENTSLKEKIVVFETTEKERARDKNSEKATELFAKFEDVSEFEGFESLQKAILQSVEEDVFDFNQAEEKLFALRGKMSSGSKPISDASPILRIITAYSQNTNTEPEWAGLVRNYRGGK